MICLFRADATPSMGTGHVMRCLALAEGLRDRGHSCHFLVAEITPAMERRLRAEGVGLSRIEGVEDARAEATCRAAAEAGADLLIIDGYQFGAEWRRALRQLGRPVMSFCDHAPEGALFADVVLSSAGDPDDPALRRRAPPAEWLIGADYVLLRRELRRILAEPPVPLPQRRSLLLTFGGSDPAGLTLPVARALCARPLSGALLELIIGGSVADAPRLAAEIARLGAGVRVHVDPPRLGGLMRQAGLALSAAGGTLGELAAFGVPSLVAIVADNQEEGARRSAAAGWCRAVDARGGDAAKLLAKEARALWSDLPLRQGMAARASGLIDGRGVERVCAALERLASTEG